MFSSGLYKRACLAAERLGNRDFVEPFATTIVFEGEKVSADPKDPGAPSKYGIAGGLPHRRWSLEKVKALTLHDAARIYWDEYWAPYGGKMARGLMRFVFLDTIIMMGPSLLDDLWRKTFDCRLTPTAVREASADATSPFLLLSERAAAHSRGREEHRLSWLVRDQTLSRLLATKELES